MTVTSDPENTGGDTTEQRRGWLPPVSWSILFSAVAHIVPLVVLLSMDLGPLESELDQAWIDQLRDARMDDDQWAETQVIPKPEEPEPEPEEEPEKEPEPEPKPEPEPEPEPQIEVTEKPEDDPEPALGVEDAPDDTETTSENPDEPVAMPDLVLESSSGPTVESGSGGPGGEEGANKFGKGKLSGSPDGSGTGDGEGQGSPGGPTRSAKPVSRPTAPSSEYPVEARRRNISGEIVAILTIDEDGRVTNVEIVKGVGGGLDELATKYLTKWRFEPALENGRPVVSTKRVEYVFELEG